MLIQEGGAVSCLAQIVPPNFHVTWSDIRRFVFSSTGQPFRRLRRFERLLAAAMYYIWMEQNKRRIGESRLLLRTLAALIWSTSPDT